MTYGVVRAFQVIQNMLGRYRVKRSSARVPALMRTKASAFDGTHDPLRAAATSVILLGLRAGRVVAGANSEQENTSESLNSYGGYCTIIVWSPLVPCNLFNLLN